MTLEVLLIDRTPKTDYLSSRIKCFIEVAGLQAKTAAVNIHAIVRHQLGKWWNQIPGALGVWSH
jgi:hypothetical protein